MRCRCCDKELSDKEVTWNDDLKDWELCTFCLDIALDAAYTGDFRREGNEDDDLIIDSSFDSFEIYSNLVYGYSRETEINDE